jgi:hypothetical protein
LLSLLLCSRAQIPHALYREDGYDHREALFGIPPYGGSIAQAVYYADSDLCDQTVDTARGFPTRELDPATGRMKPWPSPYILMVDRGGCTFVQKVRNAQRSGAAGVVIADNVCLCSDKTCLGNTTDTECEPAEPIMADDGSGSDISIPAMLMFKHDAVAVKAELRQNRPVRLEMAWNMPHPDDRVEYEIWTTPVDAVSREFMNSWKPVAVALGKRAQFQPRLYLYDGDKAGCRGSENHCGTLCTNAGRYCSTDPDSDLESGISGADVVREGLRRACVWRLTGQDDGIGAKWWDYVREFNARCSDAAYFADEACIKDAYKHAGLDGKAVDRCMNDSGGTASDKTNAKLADELSSKEVQGVILLPSTYVNRVVIRGALTPSTVLKAICAGYAEGTAPDICNRCMNCPDAVGCVKQGGCSAASGGGGGKVSSRTFVATMLLMVSVFSVAGVFYYKKTREEMREQVRGILAEYMPLEDLEEQQANGGGFSTEFRDGA